MYIISITCPGFSLSFFGHHFSLRGVIGRVCTSYQLHAQGSLSQFFGYHFSLRGVIGRVWISFFSFYIAIISYICSIICVFVSLGQMCD